MWPCGGIGVENEPDQSNPSAGRHKIFWTNLLQNILDHHLSDCSTQKLYICNTAILSYLCGHALWFVTRIEVAMQWCHPILLNIILHNCDKIFEKRIRGQWHLYADLKNKNLYYNIMMNVKQVVDLEVQDWVSGAAPEPRNHYYVSTQASAVFRFNFGFVLWFLTQNTPV